MKKFRTKRSALIIMLVLCLSDASFAAEEIQFNTDVLDVSDSHNLDLSVFSRAGYIMPGDYRFTILVNQQNLTETDIVFFAPPEDEKSSEPCITAEIVNQLGLKERYASALGWRTLEPGGLQCLLIPYRDGWQVTPDLASSSLKISIPQAFLEYVSENWDPPARWDDGVAGALLDYNMNYTTTRNHNSGRKSTLNANGTTGANMGPWRMRADWQLQDSGVNGNKRSLDWTRYYLYRTVRSLLARLTIGEDYLNSDLFDSFRFTGASLKSDDTMLPPNLRGYAPEISGVAKTNARVTVRQQGAVLYQTQVAPGAFRIQDLNDAVNGQLDVEIAEQDGTTQKFSIQTSDIPYLTRPGSLRYKLSAGRPTDWKHHVQGAMFALGEFSWGVSNGWSLYGGGISNDSYQAFATGIGRDLMLLGALSFDVTHSRAVLKDDQQRQGNSYRLSYSKRFDDYNSQITFAGYRFAEKDFMSMSDFLDAQSYSIRNHSLKEMYTVSFNQQLSQLNSSFYLDYNHRTYWNAATEDRYNLTLSSYFDVGDVKNINMSVNAYRSVFNSAKDDGIFLSLTLPWGDNGSLSYNSSRYRGGSSNQVSYFSTAENLDSYQISAGRTKADNTLSGFYSHSADSFKLNANASYQERSFSSAGLGLQGGLTATLEGGAAHRINMPGGTRVLLDTGDVTNVPLRGYGAVSHSNLFGKAVLTDVNSYYRNRFSVDVNKLSDNVEAVHSVGQATLTEGAIGYRRFTLIKGEKALVMIRLEDGTNPPFGASVQNKDHREVGIVNDDGSAYLSGIQPDEVMHVRWGGAEQCQIVFPTNFNIKNQIQAFLPCHPVKGS